jgi:hypothetical protein
MFNPDVTVEDAWVRSGGRCEGGRATQGLPRRCCAELQWDRRGGSRERAWEAYSPGASHLGGWEDVNRCRILCLACYEQTLANK